MSEMTDIDSQLDFQAPKSYYNLNESFGPQICDDSYFDCSSNVETAGEDASKTPKEKIRKTPYKTPKSTLVDENEMQPISTADEDMEVNDADKNENDNLPKQSLTKKSLPKRSTQDITQGVPARQSPRLAAIAKAIRRNNASRSNQGHAGPMQRRRSMSADSALAPTRASMAKMKAPRKVYKINGIKGLSEQDQKDLENIAEFKNKMSINKKKSDINRNNRLSVTRVKEFNFVTNARLRSQTTTKDDTQVDFTRSLRSRSTSNTDAPKGVTKVQPFNLSHSQKTKPQETNEFISLAELNLKYYTKTPTRFSTKPSEPEPRKQGTGCTIPHTPKLSTTNRSRPTNIPTREEIEERELEEALKHKFKAKPLNKKVFEAPSSGYQVEKKIVTVPEPFDITDTKKAELASDLNLYSMSKKFLSSSSLASIPHSGIKYKWEKHRTAVKPFSFDDRDKNTQQKKLENIQKVLEEEKKLAEFHAKPMPAFEAGITGVPHKKPPTPTKIQPFNLQIDIRGNARREVIEKEQKMKDDEDNEKRKFHAQSDDVVHKKPFIPEKSKKPLTDISGFTLNTEKRSEERALYDLQLKQKEDEVLAQKREMEERKKAEEEAEIAEFRRQAVHKAKPVRNYKPLQVKHSEKPTTVPMTPKFATTTRLRSRAGSTMSLNSIDSTFSS